MKKLLLTAAISGLMMSGGAFAAPEYYVVGCPRPAEIVQQQLIHKKETFTYKDKDLGLIYQVKHNNGTPPKQLIKAMGGHTPSSPFNGMVVLCTYDNGLIVNLDMKNCEASFTTE